LEITRQDKIEKLRVEIKLEGKKRTRIETLEIYEEALKIDREIE